jgi:hypothetical protein
MFIIFVGRQTRTALAAEGTSERAIDGQAEGEREQRTTCASPTLVSALM